jgi:hypothetical protein
MTVIKKEIFSSISKTTTNTKPSRIVFVLVAAAAVLSVGYITALAVLAPEQLAEAAITATDVICDGCVGTTDIANSAVTSAKIGGGQVKNSDIGSNAVTSAKIADGTIVSADMADQAIISTKIADSAVTSSKLAGGAVRPHVHKVQGNIVVISPNSNGNAQVDCPPGEILTGGGYSGSTGVVQVYTNLAADENTWSVGARNLQSGASAALFAVALCEGAYP